MAQTQPSGMRAMLPGILLGLLVLAVYFPALRGEFLWDDDSNIIKSAPLRSASGLLHIWFTPGATQQYYPLTHTSFWLDYHVWGLVPAGYHVENILLHAFSAGLLWWLLWQLGVKGAWLGAALFALHPVNAESVAWITERKNTLSGVFFLGSILAAVRFWRLDKPQDKQGINARPEWRNYFWALGLFLCALLSKTATVGLPLVIGLLIWWKRGLPSRRDVLLLAPFFLLAAALALITMSLEKNHLGAGGAEWNYSVAERCVIAGHALWFYLGKLAWPHPLMFMYPLWDIHALRPLSFLWPAAAVAGLLILWWKRKGCARSALLAAGYFIVMLFPVLGFFNVVFYHYSFISDHFQYLACIGPLALAAAAIASAFERFKPAAIVAERTLSAVLLLGLGILTWRQTGVYRDAETLWRDTLAHNPDSWMAHDNLGTCFSAKGHFDDAAAEYFKALKLRPSDYMAYNDLGMDSARRGRLDDAARYFGQALQFLPNYPLGHYNLGNVLARQGVYDEAIHEFNRCLELDPSFAAAHYSLGNVFARKSNGDKAVEQYHAALELDPDFAPAHANLGRVLAGRGNLDEAVLHYKAALQLDPASVDALANLGSALVTQKHYDEAISYYRAALVINPNSAVLHYNLSVALAWQGKKAESEKELAVANELKTLGNRDTPP